MLRTAFGTLIMVSITLIASPVNALLMSSVSCGATTCTITPDGSPVSLADPTSFSLDVDWSPQHIELIPPFDDRGEWLFKLNFAVASGTAINDGLMGDVVLNEMGAVPIGDLNVQIDDLNQIGTNITVNYQIFGPDSPGNFFLQLVDCLSPRLLGRHVSGSPEDLAALGRCQGQSG